jgi:ribose/xylose/arabinose/galactoside ABC-type transport system permease subunit
MFKESKFRRFMGTKHFSLLIVVVLLIVLFTIITGGRLVTVLNLRTIFNNMVVGSFFTLGVGMLMLFGHIDLSVGAIGSFAGCIMGVAVMVWGLPAWVAILLAIITGMICGAFNAFMVNRFHFEPFIATLATASVLHGIGYQLATSTGLPIKSSVLKWIGGTKFFLGGKLLPFTVIVAVVFFVIYGIILAKTMFGRTIYLCGGNKQAARLAGLKPKRLSYILFMNCGFLAGVCGVLYTARVGTSYATGLDSYQFTGLTAAMLGGIAFGGGSGDMLGCFLGMLILSLFDNGTSLMGLDSNLSTVFQGFLLVLALAIDAISASNRSKNWVKKSLL